MLWLFCIIHRHQLAEMREPDCRAAAKSSSGICVFHAVRNGNAAAKVAVQNCVFRVTKAIKFMSEMARGARTQKIPAWSANISANAPKDWQRALGRQACDLGISAGELVRQLLMVGAKHKFPALAKTLVAASRRYYPSRAIMAGSVLLLSLGLGHVGQFMLNHHRSHELRTRCVARHQGRHNAEWVMDPDGVET